MMNHIDPGGARQGEESRVGIGAADVAQGAVVSDACAVEGEQFGCDGGDIVLHLQSRSGGHQIRGGAHPAQRVVALDVQDARVDVDRAGKRVVAAQRQRAGPDFQQSSIAGAGNHAAQREVACAAQAGAGNRGVEGAAQCGACLGIVVDQRATGEDERLR